MQLQTLSFHACSRSQVGHRMVFTYALRAIGPGDGEQQYPDVSSARAESFAGVSQTGSAIRDATPNWKSSRLFARARAARGKPAVVIHFFLRSPRRDEFRVECKAFIILSKERSLPLYALRWRESGLQPSIHVDAVRVGPQLTTVVVDNPAFRGSEQTV
ncbi:hypothetical protein EVAR_87092_1 [Eumeta japonica]|uniref:Uncharacterized protein n=1 Tax=Eumeta variegata TaxID=151549 RepID=A0A4C1VRM4_EUMVA|nr:hypothetical protein EVAR_87092_1 [Eumeta japonica]